MCRGQSPDDATDGLGAVPMPIDPKLTGLSAYLSTFRLSVPRMEALSVSQYKTNNVFNKLEFQCDVKFITFSSGESIDFVTF